MERHLGPWERLAKGSAAAAAVCRVQVELCRARADREQKKKEESRNKPLIQRAQQAARKAKNLKNLTPAMIRTLEGLLSRMEG